MELNIARVVLEVHIEPAEELTQRLVARKPRVHFHIVVHDLSPEYNHFLEERVSPIKIKSLMLGSLESSRPAQSCEIAILH